MPREMNQNAQREPMRTIDGDRGTLAKVKGAKNRAVEEVRVHRFLAAPLRGFKRESSRNTLG